MIKLAILLSFILLCFSCSSPGSSNSTSHEVILAVNGQEQNMIAEGGFYKFVDHDDSEVFMNIWRDKSELPQVWIYLPTNVAEGTIFSEKDIPSGFNVYYSSPNDESYQVNEDYPFWLKVTEWGAANGEAKGEFYGVIRKTFSSTEDTLTITTGSFETTITNNVSRP